MNEETILQDPTSPEVNAESMAFTVHIDKPFAEDSPWMYDYVNREVRLKPSINTFTLSNLSLSNYATLTGIETLTNKTLTTPTIGSLVNMTHNHEAAAGGGTIDEDALALTNVTTNNATTARHGFAPILSNVATEYLNGVGSFATPAVSAADWKVGSTSKDASDASGTQTIAHGLGRTPVFVRLFAAVSVGNYHSQAEIVYKGGSGTTNASISTYVDGAGGSWVTTGGFILNITGTGGTTHTQTGTLAFDATNITITWTKVGLPTGAYTIIWMAT
jgi:hypothetical protein